MVKAAAENGADFVKIQSIFSEDLAYRERFEEGKTDADGKVLVIKRPYAPELERLSKLNLSLDDHKFFIDECQKRGVIPLTAVFSAKRINDVASVPWPVRVIKVASYDCASFPFLQKLAERFDHLIVSTGATYDDEVSKTAKLLKDKGKKLTLLHCVTSYPNTLDMAHLRRVVHARHHEIATAVEFPCLGFRQHEYFLGQNGVTVDGANFTLAASVRHGRDAVPAVYFPRAAWLPKRA
jgi:sialic acid synthase SpsE